MNILPFRRLSRDHKRQIEGVREGIYGKCKTGSDFTQVNSCIKIDGVQIFGVSLREIEEEFEKEIIDANFSRKINRKKKESEKIIKERKKLEEDRMETNLVEALRTWRFSEFAVAMRSVKSFNNQILCKGEIQEYNQAVNADSERSRKKLREYEEKKGAIPCLRQCLFCYRFTLGTGKISRTCGSRKCKGFETEILESIGEENRRYLRF